MSQQTTITPPYRFSSPLIVSGVPDPQFRNYTGTSPLSADVSSFNEADIGFSKFPMLQQFNLSLQYELLPNLLVEGSYAGARGVHWVQRIDLNQVPFENALLGKNTQADRPYNFIASGEGLDEPNVSNWYNSANLRIERRFSHGLSLLANYTISHATDSGGAGISTYGNQANTRAMNTYNLKLEHGLSSLDIPQKLALSANYEIPVGSGQGIEHPQSLCEPGHRRMADERHPDRSLGPGDRRDYGRSAAGIRHHQSSGPRVGAADAGAESGLRSVLQSRGLRDSADGTEFQRGADSDLRECQPHGAARTGPAQPGFLGLQGLLPCARRSASSSARNPSISRTRRRSICPAPPARH